ncbi:MAG: TlpA family protein disulfide reductase [Gemmatimonadales bacterium]
MISRVALLTVAGVIALAGCAREPDLAGSWRAALELAGGPLPFSLVVGRETDRSAGQICNGSACNELSAVRAEGDSLVIEIADYDARIFVRTQGDSLVGTYRNVGNRGPRAIPFHASRGTWESVRGPDPLLGRWDAAFITDQRRSPRVFEFRNGDAGLEASFQANSGDYGLFWGRAVGDSFAVSHFDGSFVYLLAGRLDGDTLRGTFHAGLRTQTPFVAWRSTGARHLVPPTELTSADTTKPFAFAFPDLEGQIVRHTDPRFAGQVVVIDIFGTWCPTCHDAAPALVDLHDRYHDRGLEVLGIAYEVTGDSAIDNRQIRRFRDKFEVPYLLVRGGLNVVEETAATLPQLAGFTAYPTTVFLGRDGRVKAVYAGFRGPATGAQYEQQLADYDRIVEGLLGR